MSINNEQWPERPPETPIQVYASFSRDRGGLLRVLQGALWTLQYFIARSVEGRFGLWAPVVLLPLFLAYFPLRNPIWERLYRPYGHLEQRQDGKRRGYSPLMFMPFAVALGVMLNMSQGWPTALACGFWYGVPFWGVLGLIGRTPVDEPFALMCTFLAMSLVDRSGKWSHGSFIPLMALAWVIYGIYEHRLFLANPRPEVEPPKL